MHKYLLSSVFIIAFVLLVSSCKRVVLKGEGIKSTTTVSVSSFNKIDIGLSLKANITVQSGAQPGLQLNTYDNIRKHIQTTVKDNTLYITSDLAETWTMNTNDDDITADITLPAITALTLSGAPDADIHGNISGAGFSLEISGASKAVIDNINVDTFTSSVSGAADIEVKGGTVKKADYEISGAGKIIAYPLQASETTVSISGAGKSEVTALTKLDATISGAGTIKYKGHPSVTQQVSGVGSISNTN